MGDWPFLDPAPSRREATGLPFVGVGRAFGEWWPDEPALAVSSLVLAGLVAATFVSAVWVWRCHSGLFAASALALAGAFLFVGVNVYRFPNEGLRVLAPAHAMIVLAATRGAGEGGGTLEPSLEGSSSALEPRPEGAQTHRDPDRVP